MQNLHQSHYLDKHNIQNKGNENNPKFYSNEIILFNTRQARDKKSIKNEITFIITNIKVIFGIPLLVPYTKDLGRITQF